MLSPEQYLYDAGIPARPESDLIIGIPVAAHREGNPRILRTTRRILELSDASFAQNPTLFLYLNYPPGSDPAIESVRRLDDQLGNLALGSRTAVVPIIDPRGVDTTIGAIRRRLWGTALTTHTNDDMVCMSTDIDLLDFRGDDGAEKLNPFDLLLTDFKRYRIDSIAKGWRDARLIEDLGQIYELSIEEKLKLSFANIMLGLSNNNISRLKAEANYSFTRRGYYSVGGIDPSLAQGEIIDIYKRTLAKYPENEARFGIPVLAVVSPRRRAWRISSGWYGYEWATELGKFSQSDSYRHDAELKDLYLELAGIANNDPIAFISGLIDGLDITLSDDFPDFEKLKGGPVSASDRDIKVLFLNYAQIMQTCLFEWLLVSDLNNNSHVSLDDKIKILLTFLEITQEEAIDMIDCVRAIREVDNGDVNNRLDDIFCRISERTLEKITGEALQQFSQFILV